MLPPFPHNAVAHSASLAFDIGVATANSPCYFFLLQPLPCAVAAATSTGAIFIATTSTVPPLL